MNIRRLALIAADRAVDERIKVVRGFVAFEEDDRAQAGEFLELLPAGLPMPRSGTLSTRIMCV